MHWLASFLLILLASEPANAADMAFTHWESPNSRSVTIFADGEITTDTPAHFRQYVERFAAGRVNVVFLNSGGGNLGAALELGRLFRSYRVMTDVDEGSVCLSACAYAFLGGTYRSFSPADPDDQRYIDNPLLIYDNQRRLGFHSFTYNTNDLSDFTPEERRAVTRRIGQDVQGVAGTLSSYMIEMGVDPEVVTLSSSVAENQFIFFDRESLISMNIITERDVYDPSDFELIADGDNLEAIYRLQDRQYMLTCQRDRSGRLRPVIVLSESLAATTEGLNGLEDHYTLSTIESLNLLDWSSEDIRLRRFHAGRWLTLANFDPVFSRLSFSILADNQVRPAGVVYLSPLNAEFRADAHSFHAIVEITPAMARGAAQPGRFAFHLHNDDIFGLGRAFVSPPRESNMIRAALRACT